MKIQLTSDILNLQFSIRLSIIVKRKKKRPGPQKPKPPAGQSVSINNTVIIDQK